MPDHVVVRQHPGLRSADRRGRRQGTGDRRDQLLRVPGGVEELEVERLVHLRRPDVPHQPLDRLDPRLTTEDPGRLVVPVEDPAPVLVDLVDAVLVPERVPWRVRVHPLVDGVEQPQRAVPVGQRRVLDQTVRHVHAEPGHAAVQPEPEDVEELGAHLRVRPVEVGLLPVEEVQEPLTGLPVRLDDPGPRPPAEDRRPVVRRLARRACPCRRGRCTGPVPVTPAPRPALP